LSELECKEGVYGGGFLVFWKVEGCLLNVVIVLVAAVVVVLEKSMNEMLSLLLQQLLPWWLGVGVVVVLHVCIVCIYMVQREKR